MDLLSWLNNYIFAEEQKSLDQIYSRKLATEFFHELISCGTTTSVVYVAPYRLACESAFEIAADMGIRAFIGQTLMDINCPETMCQKTERLLQEAFDLYHRWHDKNKLLDYIFSPRFAPVCSSLLMKEIGLFAQKNDAYVQTHLSENINELMLIKKLFPDYKHYTDVYKNHLLLTPKTLLGHCIHVSDQELDIIRDTKCKIIHCPDSNFFLHSGIFPLQRINKKGISIAIASDVGAGTSLYMPEIMKMFIYRQNMPVPSLQEALYYSTLGSAVVLGKEDLIGSIEEGKEADLVFIEFPQGEELLLENILSWLIYLSSNKSVISTYIAGQEVYTRGHTEA